jgi:hypothetical protein
MVFLAERIPGADKAIVMDPSFSVQADGTGRMSMTVYVDSSTTAQEFEQSLRDATHTVTGKITQELDTSFLGKYRLKVDETIAIKDRGWKLIDKLETGRATPQDKVAASPPKP